MKRARRGATGGWLAGWLAIAGAVALGWALLASGRKEVLTDDERDYAQAAIHLARQGVYSHARSLGAPVPDAYREPGTSMFFAAVWTLAGVEVPLTPEALLAGDGRARAAVRAVGIAQGVLLALAGLAAAVAARRLGAGSLAAMAALGLTVASPALRHSAERFSGEVLAAILLAALALALAALVERPSGAPSGASRFAPPSGARCFSVGLLAGVLALVRASFLYVGPALALLLLLPAAGEKVRRRVAVAALFALGALLPPGLWMARNAVRLGHFVLADRGGVVLLARAELGVDVAREGVAPALLAWTPLQAAGERLASRYPQSRFERWSWRPGSGQGNHFVRAMQRRGELIGRLGDPLAADRQLRSEAIDRIVAAPGHYLLATVPVAWRGLFAERSPELARPFDLGLPIGLALAAAWLAAFVRAVRGRDPATAALLLPVLAAYLFATLATEGLPRFQQPSLPILWAAAVAAAVAIRTRRA